jgi:hypothetical protein
MKMNPTALSSINNTVYGDFGAERHGKLLIVLKPFSGWAKRVHKHDSMGRAEAPGFNNSGSGAVDTADQAGTIQNTFFYLPGTFV